MDRKRKILITILTVVMLLVTINVTRAATEAEKQAAIDAGLAWLATQQQGNGSWMYGGGANPYADIGVTGAVLLAFIEEGSTATSGPYSANVAAGLNYLLTYAQTYNIVSVVTPAGDPDGNGNDIGVKFSPVATNDSRDIYQTGLAILPIIAVGAPGTTVTVGPQTGRTYGDVIQDTADYLAFAQEENGVYRGGWRYYANQGSSDNSTSQWGLMGVLYAQAAGATVPAWVATELAFWTVYIQNADGGSDYANVASWGSNVSRTGTLLSEQVYSGATGGQAAALAYINTQWLTTANATWNGNFGHPYAMWAAYKGLELAIGLDDETTITNLRDQATVRGGGPAPLDNPDHGWNWWEDYCEYLVTTQVDLGGGLGNWSGYTSWSAGLATAWYINILAATEIPDPEIDVEVDVKPGSFPSSVNLKSKGVTPVAIHTTDDFDAADVDPMSVILGDCAIPVNFERYDCDEIPNPLADPTNPLYDPLAPEMIGDGDVDLVLYFVTKDLECLGDVDEVALEGATYGGIPIVGTSDISFVKQGPKPK